MRSFRKEPSLTTGRLEAPESKTLTVAVVFDLDRTLVNCDLLDAVLDEYRERHGKRSWPPFHLGQILRRYRLYMLARMIAYTEVSYLPKMEVRSLLVRIIKKRSNFELMQKRDYYKKLGYKIFVVTAGPERLLKAASDILQAEIIGSKLCCGIITKDIQGKKEAIYRALASRGYIIHAIYSDQEEDLSKIAKENYLVRGNTVTELLIK